jgi:hypothetical protein
MMTTKFTSVMVIRFAEGRLPAKPLNEAQKHYLEILGLSENICTIPVISDG